MFDVESPSSQQEVFAAEAARQPRPRRRARFLNGSSARYLSGRACLRSWLSRKKILHHRGDAVFVGVPVGQHFRWISCPLLAEADTRDVPQADCLALLGDCRFHTGCDDLHF